MRWPASDDEWLELISEPPGGANHGRAGRLSGPHYPLSSGDQQALEEHFEYIIEVPIHGTRDCYVNFSCRCEACTRANRDYERDRARRAREG